MRVNNKALILQLVILVFLPVQLFAENDQPDEVRSTELPQEQSATTGYVVQIGAYRNLESARTVLAEAGQALPGLHIARTVGADGNDLYPIISATFATRDAADRAARRARAQNIPTYIRPADRAIQGVDVAATGPALHGPDVPATSTESVPGEIETAIEVQTTLPEEDTPLKKETPRKEASALSRSQGDNRPDQQFNTSLFGRPLTIGGEIGSRTRYRKDFTLDSGREDDDVGIDLGLQLEFFYSATDDVFVFLEFEGQTEGDIYTEDGDRESSSELRRGQSWIYLDGLFGTDFSLQAGRQKFEDKREWWWDENLDALRFHFKRPDFSAELGIAEELARISTRVPLRPDKEDVTWVIGRATWKWTRKQRLELFYLDQRDRSDGFTLGQLLPEADIDKVDADLSWYGLRAMGRVKVKPLGRIYYWADYGQVSGDEITFSFSDTMTSGISEADAIGANEVDGWAVDVGMTLKTRLPSRMSVTLGYARGSGDKDPNDGRDEAYRQTGLHDNNSKFRGVDSFRYYGELLRPELSNIEIATASVGFPVLSDSSVELVYHYYRQVVAAPELRGSRLKSRPLGIDRAIGSEIDLVIGIEEWEKLEIELVAGLFMSGDAFGPSRGETAAIAILKVDYNF